MRYLVIPLLVLPILLACSKSPHQLAGHPEPEPRLGTGTHLGGVLVLQAAAARLHCGRSCLAGFFVDRLTSVNGVSILLTS